MRNFWISLDGVLVISAIALLSFLGRTFLDFGFVLPEIGLSKSDLLPATAISLAFYGGWLWALVTAGRNKRRSLIVLLIYNVLLLIFGIATLFALCPSPCQTAWPTGEMLIWSNLAIGMLATLATLRLLWFAPHRSVSGLTV